MDIFSIIMQEQRKVDDIHTHTHTHYKEKKENGFSILFSSREMDNLFLKVIMMGFIPGT